MYVIIDGKNKGEFGPEENLIYLHVRRTFNAAAYEKTDWREISFIAQVLHNKIIFLVETEHDDNKHPDQIKLTWTHDISNATPVFISDPQNALKKYIEEKGHVKNAFKRNKTYVITIKRNT